MTDYANGHEKRARTRKVRRICRMARRLAMSTADLATVSPVQLADFVDGLDASGWGLLRSAAGFESASATTRRRVVTALRVY